MDTVNEGTTYTVTISFLDQDSLPVTPDSAQYRLDDSGTQTQIRDWTSISDLHSSIDVTISSTENKMVNSLEESEVRILTLVFTYGSTLNWTGTSEYRYVLVNLIDYPSNAPNSIFIEDTIGVEEEGLIQ